MAEITVESALQQIVVEHGYALIPQYMPESATMEAASFLGSVLSLEGFSTTQELRPQTISSASPNTYSGNFGTGEFPMHTDLAHWSIPPHYFALRCISGAEDVATSVFDGKVMLDDLGTALLRRTLVQPRRPLRNGKQLLRVLNYPVGHNDGMLRWDSIFLRPATTESEKSYSLILEYITSIKTKDVILLSPGDTLIVDNWRMIHSRSSVPASAAHRHIDRVYLGELH